MIKNPRSTIYFIIFPRSMNKIHLVDNFTISWLFSHKDHFLIKFSSEEELPCGGKWIIITSEYFCQKEEVREAFLCFPTLTQDGHFRYRAASLLAITL